MLPPDGKTFRSGLLPRPSPGYLPRRACWYLRSLRHAAATHQKSRRAMLWNSMQSSARPRSCHPQQKALCLESAASEIFASNSASIKSVGYAVQNQMQQRPLPPSETFPIVGRARSTDLDHLVIFNALPEWSESTVASQTEKNRNSRSGWLCTILRPRSCWRLQLGFTLNLIYQYFREVWSSLRILTQSGHRL